ncbi:3'-5' exonuclease [Corynebacterium tuscaniense]|uniref:3'-5' exonuclease n=1 Tax=Corynebacterium tuscaniense TaxID=302449 RepID=UPI00123850FE|nr:3'-5' exonuclease [Corynebacterium tuscaniense]KAA8737576.1 3'-5' exonuclease [Corynebacterium tuscaniense]
MSYQSGYAVVDLETTGFSHRDRIIEIGVVLLDSHLVFESTWETLIQPLRDIANSEIHQITATDVVDAPTFADVAKHLGAVLNGHTLVAHNASFEQRFLAHEFERAGVAAGLPYQWIDTMHLASHYLGVKKLADALSRTGIHNDFPHSALGDAQATAKLFTYFATQHEAPIAGFPAALFTTPPASPINLCPRGSVGGGGAWVQKLFQVLPTSGHKNEERTAGVIALAQTLLGK